MISDETNPHLPVAHPLPSCENTRMRRVPTSWLLITLSFHLTSCGFWNPDPAEKLADSLERNAKQLRESGQHMASFDFVPNADRARTSPRFNGDIVIRVAPTPLIGIEDGSIISVSEWFWTTYHSRFVQIAKEMEAAKKPKEPFRIVLTKSGDSILWTDLR